MPSWSLCQVLFTWPSGYNSGTSSSRTRWWSRWPSLCLMYSPPCYDNAFMLLCMFGKSLQSCPTLCDPMDCRTAGSSVHGIVQAEYWSGLPCPPPGGLPDPRTEPVSCIGRQTLYHWATREALKLARLSIKIPCQLSCKDVLNQKLITSVFCCNLVYLSYFESGKGKPTLGGK